VQVVANGPDDDFARMEPHPGQHLQAVRPAHLLSIALHGGLHGQGGVTGPHRVIFMGDWRPEERHDAVPEHLVHGAFVAVHGAHHDVQRWVQERAGLFRIETRNQLGGAFEIGKEHGHLLPLAFQGTARCKNLLNEIGRGVGERGRGLHGFGGGGRRGIARPDEHGAVLLNGPLVELKHFHLQIVQGGVIEVKLALERPVRDTAPLAQQHEDLIQHSIKVHERPSPCLRGSAQIAA
jgi:hypothetical protein